MTARALAYLSLPAHVPAGHAERLRADLRWFAVREGLDLTGTFTDDRTTRGTGFAAMAEALRAGAASGVIVPEVHHLHRVPTSDHRPARDTLERDLNVAVHAANEARAL